MAYVCDADQIVLAKPAAPQRAGALATLVALPRRAVEWISAWNEVADEAAVARDVYGPCAGKLTDGLEREMMRRLLKTGWN
ncbi:MAG: hypothetical protein V9G24_08480 [Rhodoblastus sp.]|jgi:hypothetical protein